MRAVKIDAQLNARPQPATASVHASMPMPMRRNAEKCLHASEKMGDATSRPTRNAVASRPFSKLLRLNAPCFDSFVFVVVVGEAVSRKRCGAQGVVVHAAARQRGVAEHAARLAFKHLNAGALRVFCRARRPVHTVASNDAYICVKGGVI